MPCEDETGVTPLYERTRNDPDLRRLILDYAYRPCMIKKILDIKKGILMAVVNILNRKNYEYIYINVRAIIQSSKS